MTSRDVFLKALRGEPTLYTPIWLMRQAGRYLPEYKEIREKYSFFEMCRLPEVAVEVTLQPLRRFDLDAAILFSDILVPLVPMGLDVRFEEGKGPVISNPVRTMKDAEKLRVINSQEDVPYVGETIVTLKNELKDEKALIGFSGAPFTLASYSVEGGGSKDFRKIKTLMWKEPNVYHLLMEKITETVIDYLRLQIRSGVDVVQLFDSWVGILSPQDFREKVFRYVERIVQALSSEKVPIIYFGTMLSGLFFDIKNLDVDCVGVDWRIDIDKAWEILSDRKAVQGNLDPLVMYADRKTIEEAAGAILEKVGARSGHIFNLGHGIMPGVPVENVEFLVDFVHNKSSELRS